MQRKGAKFMMFHVNMPIKFSAEAVNTAVYLHNRSPTSSLNMKTRYEYWFDIPLYAKFQGRRKRGHKGAFAFYILQPLIVFY